LGLVCAGLGPVSVAVAGVVAELVVVDGCLPAGGLVVATEPDAGLLAGLPAGFVAVWAAGWLAGLATGLGGVGGLRSFSWVSGTRLSGSLRPLRAVIRSIGTP
jgi:hypothetical protein